MAEYEIRIATLIHGWEHDVSVEVEADNRWEAAELLGKALTDLVKKQAPTAERACLTCNAHGQEDCVYCTLASDYRR